MLSVFHETLVAAADHFSRDLHVVDEVIVEDIRHELNGFDRSEERVGMD